MKPYLSFVIIGLMAAGALGTGLGTASASSGGYSTNLNALANWMQLQYNPTQQLLKGANIGGCGWQQNAYDLIDANFLGGPALEPYNPTMSAAIVAETNQLLASVGYQHNDRREILFGNPIPFPPMDGSNVTLAGNAPACPSQTPYWVVTELPKSSSAAYDSSMNHIVPALLEKLREGDTSTAQQLFNEALAWWNGVGFMDPGAIAKGVFHTRDIAYFLFAARATGFPVSSGQLDQMQAQLWSLQNSTGTIPTSYQFSGAPRNDGGHTSFEIAAMTLLAYDPRIQSQWWPSTSTPATTQTPTTTATDNDTIVVTTTVTQTETITTTSTYVATVTSTATYTTVSTVSGTVTTITGTRLVTNTSTYTQVMVITTEIPVASPVTVTTTVDQPAQVLPAAAPTRILPDPVLILYFIALASGVIIIARISRR